MVRHKAVYSPLAVASQARLLMEKGLITGEPVWYQPVLDTPPMTDFARRPSQAHQGRRRNQQVDIREIQPILRGMELHLRKKFYTQHPWELARPRIATEEDGTDYVRYNWSKIEQRGKALDGESVVQRTLYLMKEIVSPAERYQQIHGFDESQARGRPCKELPTFGNIPEENKDVEEVLQAWREIETALKRLTFERESHRKEVDVIEQTMRFVKKILEKCMVKYAERRGHRKASITTLEQTQSPESLQQAPFDHINESQAKRSILEILEKIEPANAIEPDFDTLTVQSIVGILERIQSKDLTDATSPNKFMTRLLADVKRDYRQPRTEAQKENLKKIKRLNQQIHENRLEARKMSSLPKEVAYLQACSEFYMARQQEEVEIRIAIEQANCFGRKMGASVNEIELRKEQDVLKEWKADALKLHRHFFAKSGKLNAKRGDLFGKVSVVETTLAENEESEPEPVADEELDA